MGSEGAPKGFRLDVESSGCFHGGSDFLGLVHEDGRWRLKERSLTGERAMDVDGGRRDWLSEKEALVVECALRLALVAEGSGARSTNRLSWRVLFGGGESSSMRTSDPWHPMEDVAERIREFARGGFVKSSNEWMEAKALAEGMSLSDATPKAPRARSPGGL